jgi:hypothetical protein
MRGTVFAALLVACRTEDDGQQRYFDAMCPLFERCPELGQRCEDIRFNCDIDWHWLERCEDDAASWPCEQQGGPFGPPSCTQYLVYDCNGISEPRELVRTNWY